MEDDTYFLLPELLIRDTFSTVCEDLKLPHFDHSFNQLIKISQSYAEALLESEKKQETGKRKEKDYDDNVAHRPLLLLVCSLFFLAVSMMSG